MKLLSFLLPLAVVIKWASALSGVSQVTFAGQQQGLAPDVTLDWTWTPLDRGSDDVPTVVFTKVDGVIVGTQACTRNSENECAGTAQVHLDGPGMYAISVEVCGISGCVDSENAIEATWSSSDEYEIDVKGIINEIKKDLPLPIDPPRLLRGASRNTTRQLIQADDDGARKLKEGMGSYLAKELGKSIISTAASYGGTIIFDTIFGVSDDVTKRLDDITSSIAAVKDDISNIARKIDILEVDMDFKNAHTSIVEYMSDIKTVWDSIVHYESSGERPSDTRASQMSSTNVIAVGKITGYMISSISSPVRLLMKRFAVVFPTTGGGEVREAYISYFEELRSYLALAIASAAWLENTHSTADTRNDLQVATSKSIEAVNDNYSVMGAAYPGTGIIYRVGTTVPALISEKRWEKDHLPGESGNVWHTKDPGQVIQLYQSLSTGYDAWQDESIEEYCERNGIRTYFKSGCRKEEKWTPGTTHIWVKYDETFIRGNHYGSNTVEMYHCGIMSSKQGKKCREEQNQALNACQESLQYEYVFYRNFVETNVFGLPALMDETLIAQERDGIAITNMEVQNGTEFNHAFLTLPNNGYQLRIFDPGTGVAWYFEKNIWGRNFTDKIPSPTSSGYILEAGSHTSVGFVVRQSTVVEVPDDGLEYYISYSWA